MDEIHELPIPDWGLRCPRCDHPLAGLREHQCPACALKLDMIGIVSRHRPIVDIGLRCPECDYLLTGLMSERCPECGHRFLVRDLIEDHVEDDILMAPQGPLYTDAHLKRREPLYTGKERPLPDFGYRCAACDQLLAGASGDVCLHCGEPFNLQPIHVVGEWVNLSPLLSMFPSQVRAHVQDLLYQAAVPFLVDNAGLSRAWGFDLGLGRGGLRVPHEFAFDALAALAEAGAHSLSEDMADWICPACGENVPGGFEICWSCEHPHSEDQPGSGDAS